VAALPAGGKLSVESTHTIFSPLFEAKPDIVSYPEFYEVIASTWAHAAQAPDHGQLSLILQGARLFPDDGELISAASTVFTANAHPEVARDLVLLGRRNAPDDAGRAALAALSPPEPGH
jgi:hypothetical protein